MSETRPPETTCLFARRGACRLPFGIFNLADGGRNDNNDNIFLKLCIYKYTNIVFNLFSYVININIIYYFYLFIFL